MKKLDLKKIKKRAASTAVASVASAGILVGGLFSSPTDLMNDDGSTPDAIVELAAADADLPGDDGGDEALPDEKRGGVRARVRLWILRRPPWLRALVGVPLWGLGWVLISTATALWGAVLSPVMGVAVKFLCVAALLLAVLCAVLKTAFPDVKLKELLNRRSILTVAIGLAVVGAGGAAMQVFYPEGQDLAELVRWLGGFAVLLAAALPIILRRQKRLAQEALERDEDSIAGDETALSRRMVLELADSVK